MKFKTKDEPNPTDSPEDFERFDLREHPEFKALCEKEAELHRRDAELIAQHSTLNSQLDALGRMGGAEGAGARYLETGKVPEKFGMRYTALEEMADIDRERITIGGALKVIDAKKRAARAIASKEIVERVRPEFTRRVGKVADALAALIAANEDLERISDAMEAADIAFGGRVTNCGVTGLVGRPKDAQSMANYWYRNAIELGMIDRAQAPSWVYGAKK